jgi:hypothetical protein
MKAARTVDAGGLPSGVMLRKPHSGTWSGNALSHQTLIIFSLNSHHLIATWVKVKSENRNFSRLAPNQQELVSARFGIGVPRRTWEDLAAGARVTKTAITMRVQALRLM